MERIGTLLRRLKLDPDSLQAAREAAAMKEAAPPREGTGVCAEPLAQSVREGAVCAFVNGKSGRKPKPPAEFQGEVMHVNSGEVCSEAAFATRHHMVTSLPIGRCERIAISPQRLSPVAAMRSHLLKEWLAHAAISNAVG